MKETRLRTTSRLRKPSCLRNQSIRCLPAPHPHPAPLTRSLVRGDFCVRGRGDELGEAVGFDAAAKEGHHLPWGSVRRDRDDESPGVATALMAPPRK